MRPSLRQRRLVPIALAALVVLLVAESPRLLPQRSRVGAPADRIEEMISAMSLKEKAGQLVMAGIEGYEPGDDARVLIQERRIGGVILFSRNIQDAAQVRELVKKLQSMAVSQERGLPLFIAVDQEGGAIVRVRDATLFPGNMALGAAQDADLAYRVALHTARELRAMGVNVNFAPVLDVNVNPKNPVIGVRSFGEDPKLVARLGTAVIRGLQDGGVLATAKHFPGHGDTDVDSHVALPTVPHGRDRLEQVELLPFRAAVQAGVGAIMTAHVTFPAVEPQAGLPATLSRRVLTGLLREELGFDGLVFTDALEMQAIAGRFGVGEAAVMAVEAGADVVLVAWPRDWRVALEAVEALEEAIDRGRLSEERIDRSLRRILAAKERLGLFEEPRIDAGDIQRSAGRDEGQALAVEAARRSVTLLVDGDGAIPIQGSVLVLAPRIRGLTGIDNPEETAVSLGALLARHGAQVAERLYTLDPSEAERSELVRLAKEADTVILATYNAWKAKNGGEARLARELLQSGANLIAVALGDPYDCGALGPVPAYLATYGYTPAQLEALAEVLVGMARPGGRLPVTIPGHFQAGDGL